MVRTVDKKFTFWMAGYYDDFMAARAIPDDLNTMSADWNSLSTHAGNPLNGFAPYNPRYKYAWFVRGVATGSAAFNGASLVASALRKTHNSRMSSWLTYDKERYNTCQYEGVAQIQYPDSKTNSNRQRFDKTTGGIGAAYQSSDAKEGYLMICNGYNTNGKYYAFNGQNDSSYGRDTNTKYAFDGTVTGVATEDSLSAGAGEASTGASAPTYRIDTHIAGAYMGEQIIEDDAFFNSVVGSSGVVTNASTAGTFNHMTPISSPSKGNFLVQELYISGAVYKPTLVYDGSLNSKGDNDIFTIRNYIIGNDIGVTKVELRVGNWNMTNGLSITSSAVGEQVGSASDWAVKYELPLDVYPMSTDLTGLTPTSIEITNRAAWVDVNIKLNYTAQTYTVYINDLAGVTASFNAKSDGTDWTPSDMYAWGLWAKKCEKKVSVMIDRVGLIRPLTENLGVSEDLFPVAESIKYNAAVNAGSRFDLTLVDDDSQLKMLSFFNEASYSSWSLLCFRDNVDRPFWRGTLASMRYNYSATQRTPTIMLSADDYFSNIDHEIPIWELGSGGDADSTSVVAYNRQEAQNNLDAYYFGATALEVANAGLGFNEILDGTGTFEPRVDSRMRAGSAHPIQMYLGEDEFGVNDPYTRWDDAITGGYATSAAQYRSLHSRWIKDIGNSVWFRTMFSRIKSAPRLTTRITAGDSYAVGDTTLNIDAGGQQLANGGYIEFVDADGSTDMGIVTSASYATTITGVSVGWMWYFNVEKTGGFIGGIGGTPTISHDGSTNVTGYYEAGTPSGAYAVAFVPTTASGVTNNMERTISGCQWPVFNNVFKFVSTGDIVKRGSTTYEVFRLAKTGNPFTLNILNPPSSTTPYLHVDGFDLATWGATGATGVYNNGAGVGDWNYITEYDGLKEVAVGLANNIVYPTTISFNIDTTIIDDAVIAWRQTKATGFMRYFGNNATPQETMTTFFSVGDGNITGLATVTNIVGGFTQLTLPATNFFQKDHAQYTTVNLVELTDDYKHIYVLWSDMRNDGNANAYGGFKKEQFGLLKPTGENYSVGLVYADQNTSSGEARQEFVDLAIGQDLDIWELGSTDPVTGAKWSALPTLGSNAESNSKYHDWEDKAGSFLLIDTSKFFNLNTLSNGGRTGQISGGRKEIGDFITEGEGFPILLDNYWLRATTTPTNLRNYVAWANNYFIFDNQPSSLRESIRRGDRMLQLINDGQASTPTQIPINSSTNQNLIYPTTVQLVSQTKEKIFHANVYRKLTSTNGVAVTQAAGVTGEITLTNTGGDFYYTRDGHWITISGSTTTPSIDGTYRILRSTKGSSPDTISADIKLNDSTITIAAAGTCTVELDESYGFYNLVDLGVPNPATTTAGEWDGSAYDGVVINPAYQILASLTIASAAVGGTFTLSSTNWVDYGFRIGMKIVISNSSTNSSSSNGEATITNINGSVMTVDKLIDTHSASTNWSIRSKNYNEHSAQWLINNGYYGTASVPPTITMKKPYNGLQVIQGGSYIDINIDPDAANSYEDITVYANASSIYPMRLMMQIQGYIKNKASLTFNEDDKFRMTYLDSLTKNWFNQSSLFGMVDLSSVPKTGNTNAGQKNAISTGRGGYITAMSGTGSANTLTSAAHGLAIGDTVEIIDNVEVGGTGTALGLSSSTAPYSTTYTVTAVPSVDTFTVASTNTEYTPTRKGMWRKTGEVDTFGSINDCRNTSISNIFSQVQQSSGVGENGTRSVMSWFMDRDSKPAFRTTHNNGFLFNQNNLKISNLQTESTSQINNIRLFYAGDGSFVDYPQANLGAKPRWEIIQSPEISSQEEALAVAKQEYEKQRLSPLSISCDITSLTDRALQQNDGNMLYNARYGYIADVSRTITGYRNKTAGTSTYDKGMFWTSLRGGNLFTGIQNGLDGIYKELSTQTSGYQGSGIPSTTTSTPASENYFWYGANSVSYAVQVIDIPHGMPKTSQRTPTTGTTGGVAYATTKGDGQLRVVIDIAPETETQGLSVGDNDDVGNYVFRIFLVDYDFVAQSTHLKGTGINAGIGSAWSATHSYVSVDSNGIYEIPIPAGYWADMTGDERVIVSVNYDYLSSLVKLRCGFTGSIPKSRNAHDWVTQNGLGGIAYGYTHNPSSIFPLGVRRWSSLGAVGSADERWLGYLWKAEWYAPRLHIVDDINFVPNTTLKYTDSRIELSNEPMSIKDVNWNITGNDAEKLSLTLERDVSRAAKNFTSFIIPKVNFGAKQKAGKSAKSGGGATHYGQKGEGGTNKGNPKGGAWAAKYGDENPNAKKTGDLQPILNPDRLNTPDGSTSAVNSSRVLGSSALSNNLNNRIKGVMNFKNSSVTGDNFSVLGQGKPTAAPRDPHAAQSIDSFIIPEGGDGVMTGNGFSLAGRAEGMTGQYSSMKVRIRVPSNGESNSVRIFGKVKLSSNVDTQKAVLQVSATCLETGHNLSNEVIVNVDPNEQNIVFLTGGLIGAETAGNTIEVLFKREAGTGNDDATLCAISVKNVQVANDTRSVSGKKDSTEFSYRL